MSIKTKIFGGIAIVAIVVIGILILTSKMGCGVTGAIWRGNVYSHGYRDGYIQGNSKKADSISGLGRVYELKVGFNGFGAGVDSAKKGQTKQGSWTANYYSEDLWRQTQRIHPEQAVRVFYLEKDIQFAGATDYEVLDVVLLPSKGEPLDDLVDKANELFEE